MTPECTCGTWDNIHESSCGRELMTYIVHMASTEVMNVAVDAESAEQAKEQALAWAERSIPGRNWQADYASRYTEDATWDAEVPDE